MKPSKRALYYAAVAAAHARRGDAEAVSHVGWRRAMAPHHWGRAGRWYRAALEASP